MQLVLRIFVYWLLLPFIKFIYRVKGIGLENIPGTGPVLLVSNHVSYVDAMIISAAMNRPVRFLMWRRFYERPFIGWVCRVFNSIPIEPTGSPDEIRKALTTAIQTLKDGDIVCLFPEGAMTRTGYVHEFKRGFEIISRRGGAPIIPLYIDGLWGSVFSYESGRCGWKPTSTLRHRVRVHCGKPLPKNQSALEVRRKVLELGTEAHRGRKAHQKPLHAKFWRTARRRGGRFCMSDSTGVTFTWRRALTAALIMARWMRRHCREQKMVGLMMPPSCGAALINIAALMSGKTPINLNFTGSNDAIQEAMTRCDLRTVVTSRRFLDRIGIETMKEFVFLEDVVKSQSKWSRVRALLAVVLTPAWLAEGWLMHHSRMDDLATIMFTSGSTGKPKGVMLSHHNVASNIEALAEVLQFMENEVIAGVLPPFHSFGFTATLWLPLTCGVPVVYHPNPLDAKGVGAMIEKHKATIVLGTPSFYALYTRGCKPEQFRSLRLVVAGGQRLMPVVTQAFEKRFGVPIREGYGATELSPIVSANTDDIEIEGVQQNGTCAGSVGRPLPGLSVRIVDENTMAPVSEGQSGMVLIASPSLMQGYLDDPEATANAIRDGWYVTGDLGIVDDDGFLFIHDRVSRFSKIAGEMVSHGAVENALLEATGDEEHHFAVISAPDRLRGEKLVALYDGPDLQPKAVLAAMTKAGIPNLWLPAERNLIRVDSVPLLASGKLDLCQARRLATKRGALPEQKS